MFTFILPEQFTLVIWLRLAYIACYLKIVSFIKLMLKQNVKLYFQEIFGYFN